MKKVFRIFTIAAIAFGMSMTVACTDDNEGGGNNNGNGNGGNENLPTTIDENFDNGIPTTWTNIDADGDGYKWENTLATQSGAESDPYPCAMSASYRNNEGALYPDNYLVSPKIKIPANATLTYEVGGIDANYYAENYTVYLGTVQNGTFSATATLLNETVPSVDATLRTIDLSAYAGQNLCVAFRHHDITDMYYITLDNVKVQ